MSRLSKLTFRPRGRYDLDRMARDKRSAGAISNGSHSQKASRALPGFGKHAVRLRGAGEPFASKRQAFAGEVAGRGKGKPVSPVASTKLSPRGVREKSPASGRVLAEADYAPDARARAILRGREYARADLREAGGAFDIDQVRNLLGGVTRQAVQKRVQERSLLAIPGPNGRRRYPATQFKADGTVVEGLKAVLRALPTDNPWSALNFLVNGQDALGGAKPIDRLKGGRLDEVVQAAKRVGEQGA